MNPRAAVDFDVLVIGGAPVGCAVARDAVGRGLTVALFEAGDLGGDFAGQLLLTGRETTTLTDEVETDILRRICPHLMPDKESPGSWLERLGLRPRQPAMPATLNAQRFAVLNARDAQDRGAQIVPNTPVVEFRATDGVWVATLADSRKVTARVVMDTTGNDRPNGPTETWTLALYADDRHVRDAEFQTTCATGHIAAGHRAQPASGAVWSSDPISLPPADSPDFCMSVEPLPLFRSGPVPAARARKLAEDVVAEMAPFVQMIGKRWTHHATLPGGDFNVASADSLRADLHRQHPDVPRPVLDRLFTAYGTEAFTILDAPRGRQFGDGLTEAEVSWLRAREWAQSAADVLWRRTTLGPATPQDGVNQLAQFFATA